MSLPFLQNTKKAKADRSEGECSVCVKAENNPPAVTFYPQKAKKNAVREETIAVCVIEDAEVWHSSSCFDASRR
jgi:hypothetical protein